MLARPPLLLAAMVARAAADLAPFTFRYTADPAPIVVKDATAPAGERVYIVTSHDLWNQTGYFMYDYSGISSTDLVNWLDHGIVFDVRNVTWGPTAPGSGVVTPGAWAQ